MSIIFDEKNKIFHLQTETLSYIFFINEDAFLETAYFGEKISNLDCLKKTEFKAGGWAKQYLNKDTLKEEEYLHFNKEVAQYEISNSMTIDKKPTQFLFKSKDSSYFNEFRYDHHSIEIFNKQPGNLPATFSNKEDEGEILKIHLFNNDRKIELIAKYIVFRGLNTVIRGLSIINHGDELIINRALTMNLDLVNDDYSFINFYGDWAKERNIEKVKINHTNNTISSFTGRSGHETNPSIILLKKDTTLFNSEAIIFNLIYSGNFKFNLNLDKYNILRIQAGINDEAFELKLKNEETLELPECAITYSNSGINNATLKHHDFIRKHIIRSKFVSVKRPILLNSWEGFFFDFDTKKVIEYIRKSKEIGNELFVLDDGWFTLRDDDTNGLGDWELNTKKVDLHKIIDECHRNNLKFGLWFEPEMVNPGTKLFKQHEDYVLKRKDSNSTLYRHQLMLDLSNDEVVDYLYNKISFYLKEFKIDYVKRDHNRHLSDIYSTLHPNIKEGTLSYLITLGTYKLFNKLTKEFPDVLFEGCASGGGRFDLGMLYYTPQIWGSDETCPIERTYLGYATSLIYPLSCLGAHVSKKPIMSYYSKAAISLFGTYGFEFNPSLLNESEKNEILEVNKVFHRFHLDCVINGDLIHLLDPFSSNNYALEAVSKNKDKALVIFMNYRKESAQFKYLKIRNLKKESYYVVDNKEIYSGEYLEKIGLNLSYWKDEFSLRLICIEEK